MNKFLNLGGVGYGTYYGYEAPAWKDAVFYAFGYNWNKNSSDISNWNLAIKIGYR